MKTNSVSAGAIRTLPGVVGVFEGSRMKAGQWERGAPALCAHVRWKRAFDHLRPEERLPPEVDVIEVGLPHADDIEDSDRVIGSQSRTSSITLLTSRDGATFGIISGHGALPYVGHAIVHDVPDGTGGFTVSVLDGNQEHKARILRGKLGADAAVDFALVRFDDGVDASVMHSLAGRAPVVLRAAALDRGTRLQHYSRVDNRRVVWGTFEQWAQTRVEMRLPDGNNAFYTDLLVVAGERGVPFSLGGDSGSLVVDENGDAVGAIVGSSRTANLTYVYSIGNVFHELGDLKHDFFR